LPTSSGQHQQQGDIHQPEQGQGRQHHGHRRHPQLHQQQISALVDDIRRRAGRQGEEEHR
jgi:hypothetical protein